jgi:16S rRNA processing protein RimM
MSKNETLVELGFCNKPHGIKGGFALNLHNQQESVLTKGLEVTLVPSKTHSSLPTEGRPYVIASIQFGNKAIVYFEGVRDRNQVEAMVPFKLMLERDKFPELEDGEFYLNDLIGMEAFNPAGKRVGEITSMYDNGAQTIIVIVTKSGEELEVPLVDEFFPSIEPENNRVTVIPPEIV